MNIWFVEVKSKENYFPSCRDPSILDCLDLTEEERNVLIDNINRRLTPQAVKIRAGEDSSFVLTGLTLTALW